MEKAYAQALWNMVAGGLEPKKAVHALRDMLASHGREALLPHVRSAFERLAEKELKKSDVVLTVARESDVSAAKKQAKETLSQMEIDGKDLKTQVDDSIIGGWRLEGRELLVDSSYKKQLLDLFTRAVKA